jgi:tetratricopeptide (TPR) repeat protein
MNKRILNVVLPFLFPLIFVTTCPAQVQHNNAPDTLQRSVADLQKNLADTALREKIIKLAVDMNPPPESPSDAKKYMARGVAAVEGAKNGEDFKDAVQEFEKAVNIAPWLGNGYRNLAIAQDKAGQYAEALSSLKWYLLTKPASADADWAEELKNRIEYRVEKAAKEAELAVKKAAEEKQAEPENAAARQQNTFEELLKKIDGRRYAQRGKEETPVIDVRGRLLIHGYIGDSYNPGYHEIQRIEIRGRETTVAVGKQPDFQTVWAVSQTFIISEDGERIIIRTRFSDGDFREYNYPRKR